MYTNNLDPRFVCIDIKGFVVIVTEGEYEGLSDPDGILKMLQDIKRER